MNIRILFAGLLVLALFNLLRAQAPAGNAAPEVAPPDAAAERDRLMKEVLASIQGREQEPAEAVFKNIQAFKGVPAGRLPMIMNMGFGRSLGVSCTHCHVPGAWESDDKPAKQVAREMLALSNTINRELLPKIKDLDANSPTVNCTTCHRGEKKPATSLPASR